MKAAIRYFSRGGNVKAMAEAFGRGAGIEPVSIDEPDARITEEVEILFIGGALYKYQLDERLKDYIAEIPEDLVGRAVCFGSSFLTRRPVYLIQDKLKERGITIAPQAVYSHGKPKQSLLDAIEYFAKTEINRDTSLDGLSPFERIRATRISAGVESLEEAEAKTERMEAELGDGESDDGGEAAVDVTPETVSLDAKIDES